MASLDEGLCRTSRGVGNPPAPLLFISAGGPMGGARRLPPAGGPVEKISEPAAQGGRKEEQTMQRLYTHPSRHPRSLPSPAGRQQTRRMPAGAGANPPPLPRPFPPISCDFLPISQIAFPTPPAPRTMRMGSCAVRGYPYASCPASQRAVIGRQL